MTTRFQLLVECDFISKLTAVWHPCHLLGMHAFFRIALFFFASIAHAEEDAVAKYKNFLPEQLLALCEEERQSSVPMMFNGAAKLATSPAGKLVMKAHLNSLMYDGFADYEGAKHAFQSDLGEEPTGVLTVWQIHSLGYRASRVNMTDVSFFPFDFGGTMLEDRAFLKGTVETIDEKIAYPVNHVDIKCSRTQGTCEYRQIALILPNESSWVQAYHVGEIADDIYRITRWEGQLVDAVPVRGSGCRTTQLSLNFETQEFFEIARNNTTENCTTTLGVSLPRLVKPRVSRIVDGRKIINGEFEAINNEAFTYFSSSFRNQVQEFVSKNDD